MASVSHHICLLPLFITYVFAHESPNPSKFSILDPIRGIFGFKECTSKSILTGRKEKPSVDYNVAYRGGWEMASQNSGVSAMHLFIFPNTEKAIMFDATNFGPSQIKLQTKECRLSLTRMTEVVEDCWAHAVEYDIDTGALRPLKLQTDTWSSSGGLSSNGTMVHAGGWSDGAQSLRYLSGCDDCEWEEYHSALVKQRWYSTQQILPDGTFILVGGRRMFNYEYVLVDESFATKIFALPFLRRAGDMVENNLYPFVFLSTDGNLFIFANNRSILLDPVTNRIVRKFPVLAGGSRNYPSSGTGALLPIRLHGPSPGPIQAQVLICGGAKAHSAEMATRGIFVTALGDCGRIEITDPNAKWEAERMPSPRVMGDMLVLPTGDVLIVNGAKKGTSGRNFGKDPNLTPLLYKPGDPRTRRFTELAATAIPRMYHSTAAVLPDGKVLVAGSNPNYWYNFTGVKYPTELRVEKFHPPYLDPLLRSQRPSIVSDFVGKMVRYGGSFDAEFKLGESELDRSALEVTMYAPPFATHGLSMGQRLLVLVVTRLVRVGMGSFRVTAAAPPSAMVAPPGFYMVFVVNRGVPSRGVWVQFG